MFVDFNATFYGDDYFYYYLKAIEILDGDWMPVQSHATGWSMVESLILLPVAHLPRQVHFTVIRMFITGIRASWVFPVAYMGREISNARNGILSSVACSFIVFESLTPGGSEQLFILAVLVSMYFMMKYTSTGKTWMVLLSGAIAGFCVGLRSNGIFFILVLSISHFFHYSLKHGTIFDDMALKNIVIALVPFVIVASFFMIHRWVFLGNPFDFSQAIST